MTRTADPSEKTAVGVPVQRLAGVDALRGVAMVWMTVFHFAFDLNHAGLIRQDFYRDPVWTWQRTAIVSLFLFCAGMGQAMAVQRGQGWPRFWRRWAQVAGCAVLVSAASWWMFPKSWIYFGVLHGMAVMLLLVRLLLTPRRMSSGLWLVAGAAIIASWWVLTRSVLLTPEVAAWANVLNARPFNVIGLVTRKPITEDYVPLLPWLGVMCCGVAAGLQWPTTRWAAHSPRPRGPLGRALAGLGRWSLTYYMLHQPVLIGALMLWRALRGAA